MGEGQQVDRGALQLAGLVEPGQREQVGDERAEADRLPLDAVHRLGDVLAALQRAHPVQLGVAAHRDERRAQLVARVADEAAHLLDRCGRGRPARRRCGSASCSATGSAGRPRCWRSCCRAAGRSRRRRSPRRCVRPARSGPNVEPTSTRVTTAPSSTTTMPNTKNSVNSCAINRFTLSSGSPSTATLPSLSVPDRHPEGVRSCGVLHRERLGALLLQEGRRVVRQHRRGLAPGLVRAREPPGGVEVRVDELGRRAGLVRLRRARRDALAASREICVIGVVDQVVPQHGHGAEPAEHETERHHEDRDAGDLGAQRDPVPPLGRTTTA